MEMEQQKALSMIMIAYDCDGKHFEYKVWFNYPIEKIDFPIDVAEMLVKMTIGKHDDPPRNISLLLNGELIWEATDFCSM